MHELASKYTQDAFVTQLISAKQLADKLGVSVWTLEDLIIRGVVPPHIKLGRLRRWDSTQVDAWLQGAFQTHDARAAAGAGSAQSVDQVRLRRLHTIFVQYPRFAKLLSEMRRVHTEADLWISSRF
ncbi:hypothetical protein RSP799_23025 [Ralstonia solanacearum]|nr:hypothetical protein RSP799_23025 [Ralstonia solanacearum]